MNSPRTAGRSWPLLIGSDEFVYRSLPTGILVGMGSLMIIVAGCVASTIPQTDPVVRYGVLVAAVLGFAALCRSWGAALVVAGIGFLVFGGFLVNQLGELTWHGWADAERIVALAVALIFGRLAGDILRSPRGATARREVDHHESLVKEETHDA